jgi:hypothetical protein
MSFYIHSVLCPLLSVLCTYKEKWCRHDEYFGPSEPKRVVECSWNWRPDRPTQRKKAHEATGHNCSRPTVVRETVASERYKRLQWWRGIYLLQNCNVEYKSYFASRLALMKEDKRTAPWPKPNRKTPTHVSDKLLKNSYNQHQELRVGSWYWLLFLGMICKEIYDIREVRLQEFLRLLPGDLPVGFTGIFITVIF